MIAETLERLLSEGEVVIGEIVAIRTPGGSFQERPEESAAEGFRSRCTWPSGLQHRPPNLHHGVSKMLRR